MIAFIEPVCDGPERIFVPGIRLPFLHLVGIGEVVDELGRVLSVVANESMNSGAHKLTINTLGLSTGVYNVTIRTDAGTSTQHLSVMK